MSDTTQENTSDTQRLARDLRLLVDDTEALLRHAVRDAGEGYAEARVRLEQSLRTARERLTDLEEDVSRRLRAAGQATDAYVHEHPWQAVGVGAGLGLLVGLLISRR